MRALLLATLLLLSFSACSKEDIKKDELVKSDKASKAAETKKDVPCDSKEDILKKLEEKKKAEAGSGKAFSLQGGDTGCSVK